MKAIIIASLAPCVAAFLIPVTPTRLHRCRNKRPSLAQAPMQQGRSKTFVAMSAADDADDVTKKYGLEAGLFSIFNSKNKEGKGLKAKDLLAKYGSAYLATSISLALISFGLCYALISSGVDTTALLNKVGIQPSQTAETASTVALAYAAHKAASPIRFPPTVALTPVVANLLGRKAEERQTREKQN